MGIAALAGYLLVLGKLVLSPAAHIDGSPRPVNIIPIHSIVTQIIQTASNPGHQAYEMAGNILLLSPLTLLVMWFSANRARLSRVLLIALLASTTIETLQYVLWTYRSADVDDILLNVAGAGLTYLVARRASTV